MKVMIYPDVDQQATAAARIILDQVRKKPNTSLCLATGDSPYATYKQVVSGASAQNVDFSQVRVFGLDEWVGIPPTNPGSCHHYLNEHFIRPLNISPSRVHLFDGLATDLLAECTKMTAHIQEAGGIDIMIVGIGMNGHIGFNEPGVNIGLWAHAIDLDEQTKTVGQKYFQTSTALSKGITQGFKQVFEAATLMLLANGKKKAPIIQLTAEAPVGNAIPATLVRQHKNSVVILDEEAASLLKPEFRN